MTDRDDSLLIGHMRGHSSPIQPIQTAEQPVLQPLKDIRAVVFDIYGTLFISGCGDISLVQQEDRSPALQAALATAGYSVAEEPRPWSDTFMQSMSAFRQARSSEGVEFPEVRIEEVWNGFITESARKGWLQGSGNPRLAIVDFECRVNPCWPMPGLRSSLNTIRERGLALGIVSNAQFYTPLMFEAFLEAPVNNWGFDPAYSVWSYKEREGKPSTALYRKLKSALAKDGIEPGQVLYIGNDLRNDIWPAQGLGFRTALFAGDQRSLRWRRDDPACRNIRPDLILTELPQILEVV